MCTKTLENLNMPLFGPKKGLYLKKGPKLRAFFPRIFSKLPQKFSKSTGMQKKVIFAKRGSKTFLGELLFKKGHFCKKVVKFGEFDVCIFCAQKKHEKSKSLTILCQKWDHFFLKIKLPQKCVFNVKKCHFFVFFCVFFAHFFPKLPQKLAKNDQKNTFFDIFFVKSVSHFFGPQTAKLHQKWPKKGQKWPFFAISKNAKCQKKCEGYPPFCKKKCQKKCQKFAKKCQKNRSPLEILQKVPKIGHFNKCTVKKCTFLHQKSDIIALKKNIKNKVLRKCVFNVHKSAQKVHFFALFFTLIFAKSHENPKNGVFLCQKQGSKKACFLDISAPKPHFFSISSGESAEF